MSEEQPRSWLAALETQVGAFGLAHLPRILWVVCASIAIAVALIWIGMDQPDGRLARVGFLLCIAQIIGLAGLLHMEATLRRRQHRWLASFAQKVRDYAVGNIEPLRESVAALHDVETEKPPAEVRQRPDFSEDKPLTTKERNTLLVLIHLLCGEAKIDCSRPAKAAAAIRALADAQGIQIGETTIEGYLKRLPDAVEARTR